MARRKINEREVRKLQQTKGSYTITIPIELVRKYKWKERQKLVVESFGKDKIVIKDWKKN